MTRFTLTINCDTAAFYPFVSQEDGGSPVGEDSELARLLRVAAERVEAGDEDGALRDHNGNKVGFFALEATS